MTEAAGRYPGYGWERNAGYPTAEHRAAIAASALPCPPHELQAPARPHHPRPVSMKAKG